MKNSILKTISPTRVIHNIEFSCPAASTQRFMELPDCTCRSGRPPRGQLQRFVMTTIRVMAWPVRAKLTAHGEKRLLAKAFLYQTASCVATSTNAYQPNLRASNSSGLPPRHHVGPQLQQFAMTTILVMAWPVHTELTAHATRATPGKSLSVSDCEPLSVSANTHHPSLRASNSSALHPCLHIDQHKVVDYFAFSSILCTSQSVHAIIGTSALAVSVEYRYSRPMSIIPEDVLWS